MNRTQQIIAMMILWAVALIGYDNFTKPPSKASAMSVGAAPQIVTTFTHFCCSGCYDKMFSAAKHMSWIVNASVSDILPKQDDVQRADVDPNAKFTTEFNKDATFFLDRQNLNFVDFMKADHSFRDAGLVPKRMVLKNIAHFRLIAIDPHLCCGLCEGAARVSLDKEKEDQHNEARVRHLSPEQAKTSEINLDNFTIDKNNQQIAVEYYQQADVTAFQNALERAGFSPREIKIEVLP